MICATTWGEVRPVVVGFKVSGIRYSGRRDGSHYLIGVQRGPLLCLMPMSGLSFKCRFYSDDSDDGDGGYDDGG